MNLTDEIYARVRAMTGENDPQQNILLHALSAGASGTVTAGIRADFDCVDCRETLVMAGAMYAMAAYLEMDETKNVERFTVGDVTIHRNNPAAGVRTLREQADRMIAPYRADSFSFRGV